jgi:hypothetical protein
MLQGIAGEAECSEARVLAKLLRLVVEAKNEISVGDFRGEQNMDALEFEPCC